MKLTEVDTTLNEGIINSVWTGIKAVGASALGQKETAEQYNSLQTKLKETVFKGGWASIKFEVNFMRS